MCRHYRLRHSICRLFQPEFAIIHPRPGHASILPWDGRGPVTGNTVEGNRAGWSGKTKALHLKVCGDRGPRRNFVVKQNVALSTVAGPAMTFTRVNGVTVTGNKQPLSRGSLATFPGSSGVKYDP